MSGTDPLGRLARADRPRLAVLVLVGGVVALVGGALVVAGSALDRGLGAAGLRVAVIGFLVFALGASGYVAFAVFERGFE